MIRFPRITCYFDIASAHSWFAFEELIRFRQTSNIPVNFIPIHASSIMNTIGHKMPYYEKTLRDYNFYEIETLGKVYGINVKPPNDAFEKLSNTGTFNTQRFLAAVEEASPKLYEPACRESFKRLWSDGKWVHETEDFEEICSKLGIDRKFLDSLPDDKWTLKIKENNEIAMKQKCFGVPWMLVENDVNESETFFGHDRIPLVYRFLQKTKKKLLMNNCC